PRPTPLSSITTSAAEPMSTPESDTASATKTSESPARGTAPEGASRSSAGPASARSTREDSGWPAAPEGSADSSSAGAAASGGGAACRSASGSEGESNFGGGDWPEPDGSCTSDSQGKEDSPAGVTGVERGSWPCRPRSTAEPDSVPVVGGAGGGPPVSAPGRACTSV